MPKKTSARSVKKLQPVKRVFGVNHANVSLLIAWRGSQAELSRTAGVSRVASHRWKTTGKIGRYSAFVLAQLPGCPLTFEEIRPDVKNFPVHPLKDPEMVALIRQQKAYLAKSIKASGKRGAA